MNGCDQITDAAFVYLKGINWLDMYGCTQITDTPLLNLIGIKYLNAIKCPLITEAAKNILRQNGTKVHS